MNPSELLLIILFTMIWLMLNSPGLYIGYKVAHTKGVVFYKFAEFYLFSFVGPVMAGEFHYLIAYSGIDMFEHSIFNLLRLGCIPLTPMILYRIKYNSVLSAPKINWKTDWFEWSFILVFSYFFMLMLADWMSI